MMSCELQTYFTPCLSVSGVNFEHVNAGWDGRYLDDTLLLAKRHNIDKELSQLMDSTKILILPHFLYIETCHNWQFFRKSQTLGSTLTWASLIYLNQKQSGCDHLLIKQRKYGQNKTFPKKLQSTKKFGY